MASQPSSSVAQFRRQCTYFIALLGLALLTPFVINHALHQRWLLAAGSATVIGILAFKACSLRRGRSYDALTLYGLVPATLYFLAVSIAQQGLIGLLWVYPALITFYFILPERQAWLVNGLTLTVVLPMAANQFDAPLVWRIGVTSLAVSLLTAVFLHFLTRQQAELERLATTDVLTGLSNRSRLTEQLEACIHRHRRSNAPMSLIALDLDHFKQINDQHGHDGGDAVLIALAQLLQKRLRATDTAFRLGGEEFLLLLPDTRQEAASELAHQLRATMRQWCWPHGERLSASMGVAELAPGERWQAWLKRADARLYEAKAAGRNCVVCEHGPTLSAWSSPARPLNA
ncbi:GGDEF domain-containing protein [Chitinibacteraceae bacterium HSL-7]